MTRLYPPLVVTVLSLLVRPVSAVAAASLPQLGGGDPGIAKTANVACGSTDTYFVLSLDSQGIPNYYWYKVTVEAKGDAKIAQVMPVVGSQLAKKLTIAVTIMIGETLLKISGIGNVVSLTSVFAEEFDRQRRTGIRTFSVAWNDTAGKPSLKFLVWGTHSNSGGLSITTEWARNGNETVSRTISMPACP